MPSSETSGARPGHLAVAFLGTARMTRGGPVDLIATPQDLCSWLEAHGARSDSAGASPPSPGPPEARQLLDEARRLRADLGVLAESFAKTGIPEAHALHGVQRILDASSWSWHLTLAEAGPSLLLEARSGTPLAALGPIALSGARLVTGVDRTRLRRCESATCRAWFVDRSKAGRQRWCSMARCGNREKATRHRARRRTS